MTEWKTELNCIKCGHLLDLSQNKETIICSKCQKRYSLSFNELSYAVAESYSRYFFYFEDDSTICGRCFNNPPLDTLEEAYQDTTGLSENENNPLKLLPVVKKYHDALKMAARRLIELNSINLTADQLRKVKIDDFSNPETSLNIKNLYYYLEKAFPHRKSEIDFCFKQNDDMIKRIWWVRNKMEHILYSQWPINSKVFEDLSKDPKSPDPSQDYLNYDFIKRTNATAIKVYELIMNLRPTPPEQWQIDAVNLYRL